MRHREIVRSEPGRGNVRNCVAFPQRVVGGSQFLFHILMLMYMEEKELLDMGERKERTGRGIQNR